MAVADDVERSRRECSLNVDPRRGFTLCAKSHYVKSLLVALLTLVAHAASQEREGDWCVHDGQDGTCRHIRHCPYAQSRVDVFYSAGPDTPHLCSYGDNGAIVCCPTVTPEAAPPIRPKEPSVPPATRRRPTLPPVRRIPSSSLPRPPALGDSDTVVIAPPEDSTAMRISEKKCQEYMNSLDEETTQLRADSGLTEPWCPYPPPGNELIVGGKAANSGEYPHMAALGYLALGQVNWLCGGSLISRSYVLTAAHCLRRNLGSLIAVSLGALQVTNMSMISVKRLIRGAGVTSHIYPVADVYRHPKFSLFSHYDDIALIQLEVPVRTFDLYVRPACLHADNSMDGIQKVVACGFGHTEYQDASLTRILKQVTLNVYSPDVCSEVFSAVLRTAKLSKGIVDSQLCAGNLAGGKDTCDGDSGGPLQMRDKKDKCIIRIIGVTSFGTALCGLKNTAALYTSVAHYLPWIEQVVWPSP